MKQHLKILQIVGLLTVLLGAVCLTPQPAQAWLQTYEVTATSHYGFLYGVMHGFLAPFAVIAQLFDKNIILYSSVNNGFLYNLGFMIGISMIIGGGCKSSCRGKCD